MDFISVVSIGLQVVGGATVLLNVVAPLTKNKNDDKLLVFLKKLLGAISLNVGSEDSVITVRIKKK